MVFLQVGFDRVFEFVFVEVEDEDFVTLLQEVSGQTATDALSSYLLVT